MEHTGKLAQMRQEAAQEKGKSFGEQGSIQVLSTLDKGHGRIEKRTYFYSTDLDWMMDAKEDWEKLTGIGMVIREMGYSVFV